MDNNQIGFGKIHIMMVPIESNHAILLNYIIVEINPVTWWIIGEQGSKTKSSIQAKKEKKANLSSIGSIIWR